MKGIRITLAVYIFVSVGFVPADEFAYSANRVIALDHSSDLPLREERIGVSERKNPFPAVYFPSRMKEGPIATGIGPLRLEDYKEESTLKSLRLPITLNSDIVAFYGSPISVKMGILGEYPMKDLARLLKAYAALYDKINGERGSIPAFYLIYGTCWPGGEIGILDEEIVKMYVEYAEANGILVFLDHQIGKYSVPEAMTRLLPWLSYPNVHLALDPEWRTLLPMEEIGQVSGEEINQAQAMMRDSIAERGISGTKMLVIHQFNYKMIQNRGNVRTDIENVQLIHCADGFGSPDSKKSTYAYNALAKNMPHKGFKLFMRTDVPGAGFDMPLLEPPEVMALDPKPVLVMYQ